MLVKICGVRTLEDARQAVEAGADALGFNFFPPSPRYIEPLEAQRIISGLAQPFLKVAVVVINRGVAAPTIPAEIDIVQVNGARSEHELSQFPFKVWAAVSPHEAHRFPEHEIVIDPSWGSGRTADWGRLALEVKRDFILSGGLSPENIDAALSTVRPAGVDVCSGVERSPGCKSHSKVKRFIDSVRRLEGRRPSPEGAGP